MPVVTLDDLKKRDRRMIRPKAKAKEMKEDKEDDYYRPGYTLDEAMTDDDEDLIEEAEKDYSGEEWEEENDDGNITIHTSGAPTETQQIKSLKEDDRWAMSKARSLTRFKRVIEKAKINSIQTDGRVFDFDKMPMPTNPKFWTWQEDPEGTHEMIIVKREDGSERRRFVKVKAKPAAEKTLGPGDEPAVGHLRSGKKRRE